MLSSALHRSSGVLLHPTSLPGPFGIGDLGPIAYRWVETLAAMKQSWWQLLPLGPTGAGDSPYQSFSAFAGNVNLLSPELLEREGLATGPLGRGWEFAADHVDFQHVGDFKQLLLRAAWDGFRAGQADHLKEPFATYQHAESSWLRGYTLFMAIREKLGGVGLTDWPADLLRRNAESMARVEKELSAEIGYHAFGQFLFDRQWLALRQFAAEKGVQVIGDVPIFVALDSADVWANPDQFLLDAQSQPTVVAGVPPDYFSANGQHWGNPIYDWERMRATGYSWWCARLKRQLAQVGLIRLDHFRGFRQAWHIPAEEKTAVKGKWVDGPGIDLFNAIRSSIGGLPFIAEDLGLITRDVDALRLELGLPGMRVLQFAGEEATNLYWPHNYDPLTVCYTGTHDNDTTASWFKGIGSRHQALIARYLDRPVADPAWEMIRLVWASVAVIAIAPLQDLMGLGGEARMNKPGVGSGNWRWRFQAHDFQGGLIDRLAELTELYNRIPNNQRKEE